MRADTLAPLRADTLLDTEAYKLAKVKAKTLLDIISDVVGKILVDFVADTVAEAGAGETWQLSGRCADQCSG